jgi:Exoribonuclease R
LDLDLPERRILLDEQGEVRSIEPRRRHDSHRLIEEFMIAANVAAAETLERARRPCMYRVHDAPDAAKVEALREFVATLGFNLAKGQVLRPKMFTQLLERVKGSPFAEMVHELVLRSQSQAVYSPVNIGHFGLALARYCHFTSPIRRYSDLLVHRALIDGCRLGDDGLPPDAEERFPAIGEHISTTERRAAAAERDAGDRFIAAFLAKRVGEILAGRVTGVTRFGLFVRLADTGADGLVPSRACPRISTITTSAATRCRTALGQDLSTRRAGRGPAGPGRAPDRRSAARARSRARAWTRRRSRRRRRHAAESRAKPRARPELGPGSRPSRRSRKRG